MNGELAFSHAKMPGVNEEVHDVAEAIHFMKPTTRSEGTRTRRNHPNTNSEVGTQTQKDQLRSRDKSSSKSKGGFPVLSRSSSQLPAGDA